MKKRLFKVLLSLSLLFSFVFAFTQQGFNKVVLAETNTESEYVNTLTEEITTSIPGGITLHEQKMESLLNGDPKKYFQEHFVQWVDMDSYDTGDVKLVAWTKQNADKWQQATTAGCAEDWEKAHPGWIVLAGINGDFFKNSGTPLTFEPTNNFMADGDMYRVDYVGGTRKVLGINPDNSIIFGDPSFSKNMMLYIYDENDQVVEKIEISRYNQTPSETGITLLTKDYNARHDLTGYTVFDGKYEICRIATGSQGSVFVKGAIEEVREGTADEKPLERGPDASGKQVTLREFYLVTKDESLKAKLAAGTKVKCQYDYTGDWKNVQNSCGYIHQMISNGQSLLQQSTDSFVYTDHPRTFIGFKADGTPVLMVVDGRGDMSNKGVSLFEGAEIMRLAGCVSAFNLDGGGSSTLIVRNENGSFRVVNRPSDGSPRSTGNALFLVMRDPAAQCSSGKRTATSLTVSKKTDEYSQSTTDMKVTINGVTKELNGSDVVFGGLEENTTYSVTVEYKYNGELCKSSFNATTSKYNHGVLFVPNSYGFDVMIKQNDTEAITSKVTVKIDDKTYQIDNSDGKTEKFIINDLSNDEEYEISFDYEITVLATQHKYTRTSDIQVHRTLNYIIPELNAVTYEIRRGKIQVKFGFVDDGSVVSNTYLLVDGEKIEVDLYSIQYNIDDYDETKEYTIVYVVEYETPEGETYELKSEPIVITVASQQPNPDPNPTPTPTPTPTPEPAKKGCKKKSVASLIGLTMMFSIGLVVLRKKK